MSRSARVTSIDVLDTLSTALQRFRSDAKGAMDDLQMQLQRAREWIHYDRKEYWARELRHSEEAVSEARVQLNQARTARKVADHEPACIDEKRALERAKRRYETARQKVEAVRHWTRAVERAVDEAQGTGIRLRSWVDTDLSKAVAALTRMSASLETYISLEAPAGSAAPTIEAEGSSTEGDEAAVEDVRGGSAGGDDSAGHGTPPTDAASTAEKGGGK